MVRTERLELSHLAAPEPKSGVSTNFTTSATYLLLEIIKDLLQPAYIYCRFTFLRIIQNNHKIPLTY